MEPDPIEVWESGGDTYIRVKVKTGCSRFGVSLKDGIVVVSTTERPQKNRANNEIEKELSRLFKKRATIESGHNSNRKTIRVEGATAREIRESLSSIITKK